VVVWVGGRLADLRLSGGGANLPTLRPQLTPFLVLRVPAACLAALLARHPSTLPHIYLLPSCALCVRYVCCAVCCSEQQLQANLAAATDPSYRVQDPFVAAFVSLCIGAPAACRLLPPLELTSAHCLVPATALRDLSWPCPCWPAAY